MGQVLRDFPELLVINGADDNEWTYNGTKGGIQLSGDANDFDGATVVVQVKLAGGDFITDPNFSLTEAGIKYFSREAPLGALYRFFLSGIGSSAAIVPTFVQNNK